MDFVYLLQQFRNIGMGDDFVTPLQCVLLLVALFSGAGDYIWVGFIDNPGLRVLLPNGL